ncbi:YhfT family protein, partial [Streptomyces sp. NPDC001840]
DSSEYLRAAITETLGLAILFGSLLAANVMGGGRRSRSVPVPVGRFRSVPAQPLTGTIATGQAAWCSRA